MDDLAGIFGPSKCGKTTLAIHLSREMYRKHKIRSLVLDPKKHKNTWGPQAIVFDNSEREKFFATLWASQNCFVIIDESTSTIARDQTLIPLFTEIRHSHKLLVIGHGAQTLLPIMRQQLETLFLFLQSEVSARKWVEETADKGCLGSAQLQQYEFIYYRRFKGCRKMKLTI